MKPLYLLTFLLAAFAVPGITRAQAQDTLYYDILNHHVAREKAQYIRVRTTTPAGSQVVDRYLDGKMRMTGTFIDDSMKIRTGKFDYYYKDSGNLMRRNFYEFNKENGPDTTFYPDGKIHIAGTQHFGKMDGEWTGYYPDGKLSGKAVYKDSIQQSATIYQEDGSVNNKIRQFYVESNYPGGIPAWIAYLQNTLRYPNSAVRHEIQGTVVIQFKVTKDGKPSEFEVIRSADPSLDMEALRVLKKTTRWDPAIIGGQYADTYKRQPIIFKLTPQ
jgi:TonB family protein